MPGVHPSPRVPPATYRRDCLALQAPLHVPARASNPATTAPARATALQCGPRAQSALDATDALLSPHSSVPHILPVSRVHWTHQPQMRRSRHASEGGKPLPSLSPHLCPTPMVVSTRRVPV